MVDKESIKSGSDLVNSVLFARGYFPNSPASDEPSSTQQDKLLFSTINIEELSTDEQIHSNDKLVLNTIYSLLEELDRVKTSKQYLSDQLADKTEIIKHYQVSNKELNAQVDQLQRRVVQRGNEISLANENVRALQRNKVVQERQLQHERNVNASLKVKYEVEMKKKSIQLEKLQDKLLGKRHKYQSVIERNNHSFEGDGDDAGHAVKSKKLVLDDELESMMVNLSEVITNLTSQTQTGGKLVNFVTQYLSLLTDDRYSNDMSNGLPPTPKFFYDNTPALTESIEIDQSSDMSILDTLSRLYDLIITNNNGKNSINNNKSDHDSVIQLQKEIVMLRKNLEIAMDTNEKWSKRFNNVK